MSNVQNLTFVCVRVSTVDQEFDSISCLLLKRTKDMVNKYRQLLVREAQVIPTSTHWCCDEAVVALLEANFVFVQQESPSAEMVMLERLFLQAERHTLAEDKRMVRRDPGQQTDLLWDGWIWSESALTIKR